MCLSGNALRQKATHLRFTQANLATHCAATYPQAQPFHVQQVAGRPTNDVLCTVFGVGFPELSFGHMLLEAAGTDKARRR